MKGAIKTVRGKDRYYLDGKEVTKRAFFKAFPDRLADGAHHIVPKKRHAHWPMVSVAMAVHSSQVDLARELDKKRGAPPTEYKGGCPVWTSERHKRAYCRAHGVHDNNSYS